jgi:hypothetical protein
MNKKSDMKQLIGLDFKSTSPTTIVESPTSIVDYKSVSPVKADSIEEKEKEEFSVKVEDPIPEETKSDFISTISSLVIFLILVFVFNKILNVAYDYRQYIPGAQLAQTLHNYTVLLGYFRKIISNFDSIYAQNLIILMDTVYYFVFLMLPMLVGLPDEVREYIINMQKVFAGRPHVKAFLSFIINYLKQNGFNSELVEIMKQSLELASDFFRIQYTLSLDAGASKQLAKITTEEVTKFVSENNALILSQQPDKLALGLNILKNCFNKITKANSFLRATVDFEPRSENVRHFIGNTFENISANLKVLYRRNIKGENDKDYDSMLHSETDEIVPYEPGFTEKIVNLQSLIEQFITKFLPLLNNPLPLNDEIEGGKRRKSRKNKRNKGSKNNKKQFKPRKRYSKTKRSFNSLFYKLFL